MHREHHQWPSPHLGGRNMQILQFGHAGHPVLVFPSSMGKFYEYEDQGMVGTLWDRLNHGHLMLFCVDSVDAESWYNKRIHPADRVRTHDAYERYILHEVLPLIRHRSGRIDLTAHGCSFGGYHALNFSLRHPDAVTKCVSLSGAFDNRSFLHGHFDELAYLHNPVDYVPNLDDPWFHGHFHGDWFAILASSNHDICLGDNYRMADLLGRKHIPHRLDVWNNDMPHDWPLWRLMARAYFA
jgi:esterase/lipase superfamily enzyme